MNCLDYGRPSCRRSRRGAGASDERQSQQRDTRA
jgi:hypothetical protein